MKLIDIVNSLEGNKDEERREIICSILDDYGIEFERDKYQNGQNIVVYSGRDIEVGVASHYDAVPESPGANDNASAVAVTIDVLRRVKESSLKRLGVRGFFFDQEEYGLIGSEHYIKTHGNKLDNLLGLYNMEMVGSGDRVALWSTDSLYEGILLRTFEGVCSENNVGCFKFPGIRALLHNTGDHQMFVRAGVKDSFCITAVCEEDMKMAEKYFKGGFDRDSVSRAVYSQAPLFSNYHKTTDIAANLKEETLQMVSNLLFSSICRIDDYLKSK